MKRFPLAVILAVCVAWAGGGARAAQFPDPAAFGDDREPDPGELAGFMVDPGAVAGLYRHLSDRMAAMTASGRTVALKIHEHGKVHGNPAVLLAYGEEKKEGFRPVGLFAVDEGGRMYEMVNDTEFLPLEFRRSRARDIDIVDLPPLETMTSLLPGLERFWVEQKTLLIPVVVLSRFPLFRFIALEPPPLG